MIYDLQITMGRMGDGAMGRLGNWAKRTSMNYETKFSEANCDGAKA